MTYNFAINSNHNWATADSATVKTFGDGATRSTLLWNDGSSVSFLSDSRAEASDELRSYGFGE